MLFYHCFIIFCAIFIVTVTAEKCHTAAPGERGYEQHCKRSFGCAMVKYVVDNQMYQTRDKARYMCVERITHLHPVFAILICPRSSYQARCYDQFSTERVDYSVANGLKLPEQTLGEILRDHGIDRYCCCKGNECNKVNSAMMDHFNPGGFSTFQETLDMPEAEFYPGGRLLNSDQTRWHQGSSSALQYSPFLFLLCLIFYFAF